MFNPATSGNHKGADWPMGFFPCMKKSDPFTPGGLRKAAMTPEIQQLEAQEKPKIPQEQAAGFQKLAYQSIQV